MGHHPREPAIRTADAEDLLADPYPSLAEALAVARRLRAAGWVVLEQRPQAPARPDGVRMVASVYHPDSYESPGDLRVLAPEPAAEHDPPPR